MAGEARTILRTIIRDTDVDPTAQRYSNAELDVFLANALNDISAYSGVMYTVAALEALVAGLTASQSELGHHQLMLMLADIKIVHAESSDVTDFVKFSTQDTVIDPGDAGTRLAKMLKSKQDAFLLALNKWIGIDNGTWSFAEAGETPL